MSVLFPYHFVYIAKQIAMCTYKMQISCLFPYTQNLKHTELYIYANKTDNEVGVVHSDTYFTHVRVPFNFDISHK